MEMTAAQVADLVGGRVIGDPETRIDGVNGLEEASAGDLVFVRSRKYADALRVSGAAAALVPEPFDGCRAAQILVDMPDLAFARILQHFKREQTAHPPAGVHPAAAIGAGVVLGEDVAIGPFVAVGDGCVLGDRVVLYPGVVLGRNVAVGPDSVLFPNAVVREECVLGARCVLHANASIGSDGFGFAFAGDEWLKIPQVGRVVLADDVEVGSGTAIDRATFGETRIGRGTKIDNLVQIGHNVSVGEHCVIAGKVGIAGSAKVGNRVRIGAQTGVNGHIEIGDGATIGARAGVTGSVPAGATVSGFPAIDHNQQRRVLVAQTHLPEMGRRLRQMERRLEELEQPGHEQTTHDRG